MQGDALAPNKDPLVSVVIATYNRSNVLRYAIESVLRSSFEDWELRVIGDACTDDTAEVVASFGDPRIHFLNLEQNFGEQSGPSNVGAEIARGRYLAYLNHDDLYFPDHLERAVAKLEATGADLVYSQLAGAMPSSAEALESGRWQFEIYGITISGEYRPDGYAPCSSWVLRRELVAELGGWKPARECYCQSSQDFLFRAWKAGKRLQNVPSIGVLVIPSGFRSAVYAERQEYENAFFAEQMIVDPTFRDRAENLALQGGSGRRYRRTRLRQRFSWLRPVYRAALLFGINPRAITSLIRYGGKGRMMQALRLRRGLKPL